MEEGPLAAQQVPLLGQLSVYHGKHFTHDAPLSPREGRLEAEVQCLSGMTSLGPTAP